MLIGSLRFLFEFTLSSLLYPENLEGITRLFSTLDSNSDGVLTYEDFKEERFKSLYATCCGSLAALLLIRWAPDSLAVCCPPL